MFFAKRLALIYKRDYNYVGSETVNTESIHPTMFLSNFHTLRPAFETAQEKTLEWLGAAHTESERTLGKSESEVERFGKEIREKIWHVGCKPDRIAMRGHVLSDFLHQDWDAMKVYRLKNEATGVKLGVRMVHYKEHAEKAFQTFYEEELSPPDDLIHVTCTGYVSPSAAQTLVSQKNWGEKTTVTHAYHMGCYGALPAVRMGKGFLAADGKKNRVDIVHTELCSLHINPSLHRLDQLVSQSLFADGFIRYSLSSTVPDAPCLQIHAVREEIIPESTHAMRWDVVDWGNEMSLSKEVIVLIARAIRGFLERLSSQTSWSFETLCSEALFAVHPGGPKILSHVQEMLGLKNHQMEHSSRILFERGNMSSATLPSIWEKMVEDPTIKSGPIVSLAFGPGLTLCGAMLEKR
jgi:predicted naringenin-chalcone synthase